MRTYHILEAGDALEMEAILNVAVQKGWTRQGELIVVATGNENESRYTFYQLMLEDA